MLAFILIGKMSSRSILISSHHLFSLICRFGKVELTTPRGRRTLCNLIQDNEILNEQLQRIKSAQTVDDFEKLLQEQLRRNQHLPRSAKPSVQPYDNSDKILQNRTCLSERDKPSSVTRRFDGNQLLNEQHRNTSSSASSNS